MPDSITIKGTGSASFYGGRFDNPGGCSSGSSGTTNVTIPTLGYTKADITASSSNVGTGKNIDIREVNEIVIKTSYTVTPKYHEAYKYWYGDSSGSYSVTLHN